MRKILLVSLLAILSACASIKISSGVPLWRFDGDGTAASVSGAIAGALIGRSVRDGIDMPAPELLSLLSKALNQFDSRRPDVAPGALSLGSASNSPSASDGALDAWPIAESKDGEITTDWQPIPGKKAGILWWEKYYETEVRHAITVTTAHRDPQLTSFTIRTEVRERPNVNYPWESGDSELGRKSFENIRSKLVRAVQLELSNRRSKKK